MISASTEDWPDHSMNWTNADRGLDDFRRLATQAGPGGVVRLPGEPVERERRRSLIESM